MITIQKYPLDETAQTSALLMPKGAQILSVAVQGNRPCLWALVDLAGPTKERRFAIVGTGKDAAAVSPGLYVGTYQRDGGAIVGHVFDMGEW